jgi:type IV secretion system protein TrbG
MVVAAALEQFMKPASSMEELVHERFDEMNTRFDRLEHDIRLLAETVALHARYHFAVMPPLPQAEQREASARGDERFRVLVGQVVLALSGCGTFKPPQISFDENVPLLPDFTELTDDHSRSLHVPPPWSPTHGGNKGDKEAQEPVDRIETANAAARVEPRRAGYFNAVQVFSYSPGALYQIYAAPGEITDIALEPGEQLIGSGPLAAGDTVRWIVADTESGTGDTRRIHIMVKPTRPGLRPTLSSIRTAALISLNFAPAKNPIVPSVVWFYPEDRTGRKKLLPPTPIIPESDQRRYRYTIEGDKPPWRPLNAYDDGRKVYIEFSPGIAQGEMPPLFVIGLEGKPELVNYRAYKNVLIVDRLFCRGRREK